MAMDVPVVWQRGRFVPVEKSLRELGQKDVEERDADEHGDDHGRQRYESERAHVGQVRNRERDRD